MSGSTTPTTPRLGLFGRGRLATAIADAAGDVVAWQLGRDDALPTTADCDVVIDASIAEAVDEHLEWALGLGVPLVIAATSGVLK